MGLTAKQHKFLASYQITMNATESAINAGYSAKSAAVEGCRLLKNPKIISEIEAWKAKKREEFKKEDFIEMALEDYRALDVTEPNRPRFLDLAAKGAGHIQTGSNIDARSITQNTLNVNGAEISGKTQAELWDLARKLLSE